MKMFDVFEKEINDHTHLTIIDIPSIDTELKEFIDKNLVPICEGNSSGDIKIIKQDLIQLFKNKKFKWKMGAIAEFFIHLYMQSKDYKQEFLFRNLEEDSIKKGFDGLFSKNDEFWLMESKSGSARTKNICHKTKVKEAMDDLGKRVAGIEKKNNPWREAYNHASHMDVHASDSLRSELKKLRDNFTQGIFNNIKDYNTIPCGTIFLNGIWKASDKTKIVKDIKDLSNKLCGKEISVICITQESINMFLEYIKS